MPIIEYETTIDAPPKFVSEVFYDFASFPNWNSLIHRLVPTQTDSSGKPVVGSKVELLLHMGNAAKPMVWEGVSTVTRADAEGFGWQGSLGHKFIFRGVHKFEITPAPTEDGQPASTVFKHSEKMTGILSGPVYAILSRKTRAAYAKMNEEMKTEAEKRFASANSADSARDA
ncbi:hypothetical protein BKA62DRAFT_133984 [Auriculariales sp. MPI-PUGE-AT-0066]|nr:hypothetical protein BKA62DRAFT_133984 [Auriculariales sp. MPI-PUGE-AT-0066]